MGRLSANTTFKTNSLNDFLTENAPNGRVLSGEVIIFQNEMQEVFRKLINMSAMPIDLEEAKQLTNSASMISLDRSTEFTPLSCKYC